MGVFSNLVIAISGSLDHPPQHFKKWVEANGGRFSPNVKKGPPITHLVSSKDAWKNRTEAVEKAAEIGAFVVSYDWLEDSLHKKRKLSERNYTWDFLCQARRNRKQLKRLGMPVDGEKFKNGCVDAKDLTSSGMSKKASLRKPKKSSSFFFQREPLPNKPFDSATEALKKRRAERKLAQEVQNRDSETRTLNLPEIDQEVESSVGPSSTSAAAVSAGASEFSPEDISLLAPIESTLSIDTETKAKNAHIKDLYHYYQDTKGFEYRIKLTRSDLLLNNFAQYQVGLLESHVKPHSYCTVIQYSPPAKKPSEPVDNNLGNSNVGLRKQLLNFLKDTKNDNVPTDVATPNKGSGGMKHRVSPDSTAEATQSQLRSLIEPATSCIDVPYNTLICPMNSSFSSAWRAFRHAFRDLTLLSWEERFKCRTKIQLCRAKQLGIEPFLYTKPKEGLPIGLFPQETGLYEGTANGLTISSETEDGYTRNAFDLPAVSHALSKHGAIGLMLFREEEERKKREEMERMKAEEKEGINTNRKMGVTVQKKANFNKPLFNCVTGTPMTDAYGRYTRNPPSTGNTAKGGYMGMVKPRRPFPSGWVD